MMKTRCFVLSLVLAALPFLTGCGGNALQNGDISLSADKDGNLQLTAAGAVTPLLQDVPELSGLRSGGGPVAFSPVSVTRQEVSDSFGEDSLRSSARLFSPLLSPCTSSPAGFATKRRSSSS